MLAHMCGGGAAGGLRRCFICSWRRVMAADGMFPMLMEMYPDAPPEDGLPAPLAAIAQDAILNEPEAEPLTEEPKLEPSSKVRKVRGKTPCAGTGFPSAIAVSAQQIGLHQPTYNRLRRWGVPRVFLIIIGMVLAATQGLQGAVDAVEGFSGMGRIDTAFKSVGIPFSRIRY